MTSISNISDVATEETNATGVLTPILAIVPTDGTSLVIRNMVQRGQQDLGIPVYAELQDSNGNDLPADTTVGLAFEQPGDDDFTVVSETLDNIRPYRALSIQQQQNEEYVDRVKHVLKGEALVVDHTETFYVVVDSSAQIDWSNSRLQFDESAVREV